MREIKSLREKTAELRKQVEELKRDNLEMTLRLMTLKAGAGGIIKYLRNLSMTEEDNGRDKVTGTLVYPGRVEGRAFVVNNVNDSVKVESGDILIAVSTDVGWSPLFPLVSGIVTELGGLISHGAVVAREYGVPCLVGATFATTVFKTGDRVVLDASRNVIYKTR